MDTLTKLANNNFTDKGGKRFPFHGYTYLYDMLFSKIRNDKIEILELGLARTNEDFRGRSLLRKFDYSPSVNMWLEYFPNSHVTGFDLSSFDAGGHDSFTFIQGDLGNADDLKKIAGLNKSFDIIIDDGSHASFHQQLAFTILFALLKNDGYYIIEDLLKPPKKIDFEYNPSHTTAELLMSFLKTGYFPHTHPIADSELNKYLDSIGCVSLFNQYLRENTPAQLALIYKKENSNFYKYRSKIQFIDSPASESDLGSLLKYSEISPENPYPEYHIAQIHFNNGDYQIALDHVDNALAKADFDYEISLLKILCLYEKGQCDAAFELCKITTDNAVLTENLAKDVGNHLIKRGLIDEAIRILNHCLGLCPMTSRIHYLLGRCMEENKNYTGAGNYYKSAIDILPTLLLYYKAYFRVSRLLGRKDFLPYFDDRRINFKHDKRYNLLMSRIYFYLQDYCSALREANDASQDKELQDEAEILITKTKKFME